MKGLPTLEDAWNATIALENRYWGGPMSKDPDYWSNALFGEAGEVANATKHRAGGGSHAVKVSDADLLGELTDTWGYLAVLSARVGWDAEKFSASVLGTPSSRLDLATEVQLSNRLGAAVGWVCRLTSEGNADRMGPEGDNYYALPRVARMLLNIAWRSLRVNYPDFLDAIDRMIAKNVRRMESRMKSTKKDGRP